jgi:hypothetical protein
MPVREHDRIGGQVTQQALPDNRGTPPRRNRMRRTARKQPNRRRAPDAAPPGRGAVARYGYTVTVTAESRGLGANRAAR